MDVLKKILLPFFPDDSWLREHWWHRIFLVIYGIISIFSYTVILINIFKNDGLIYDIRELYFFKQTHSQRFDPKNNQTEWEIQNKYTGETKWVSYNYLYQIGFPQALTNSETINVGNILIYLFVIFLALPFSYRVLLFIFLGDNWKKNNK